MLLLFVVWRCQWGRMLEGKFTYITNYLTAPPHLLIEMSQRVGYRIIFAGVIIDPTHSASDAPKKDPVLSADLHPLFGSNYQASKLRQAALGNSKAITK